MKLNEFRNECYEEALKMGLDPDEQDEYVRESVEKAIADGRVEPEAPKPMVYEIPEVNMAALAEKLEAMNRRAKRLGLAPIESHVLATRIELVPETYLDAEGCRRQTRRMIKRRYYTVELKGEALKLPGGWAFLGTLQHTEAGNVLRAVPGEEIPESYRTVAAKCDHCKVARRRKDTYLVRDQEGQVKQIGHQCVRDYLGHVTPEMMGLMATVLQEMRELGDCDDAEYFSRGVRPIYTADFLEICAALTLRDGFVPKAAAMNNPGMRTTTEVALSIMFPDPDQVRKGTAPTVEITDEALELTKASLEWAKTLVGSASGYEANLAVLSQVECLERRDLGLIASLPAAYRKTVLKIEREKKAKVERAKSEFFGTVGKREVFELTVVKELAFESAFKRDGYTYLYIMRDKAGNTAKWMASSKAELQEGKTYQVKATVKKHDMYKEEKQTVLTRCAVEAEVTQEAA